jgi:polyhydroxyalkanoate synthase subunit PhaC
MSWRELWDLRNRARKLAEAGIDATPKEEVHREGKWVVRAVLPSASAVPSAAAPPPPVLLVPPLMVRPMVFDLQPDHSFVRLLTAHGLRVYVLDLGVPDRDDRNLRLDDYVLDVLPAAVDAVLRHAGAERLSLVGYCLGGLFCLLHVAAHRDERVARIVTIASPIDFSKMGFVGLLGAAAAGKVDPLIDAMGVIPGWMAHAGFQLLSGRRAVARLFELRDREADEAYLRSYGSISRWLSGLVPYPGEAFKQLLRDVMRRNQVHRSWLTFGARRIDLGTVACPVLAFAGATDAIAPVDSVVALRAHLPPGRVVVRLAPGGHVGVLGGPEAPRAVWEPAAEFLRGGTRAS